MSIYFAVLVFILGLLVGSFLNVCIFRIPLRQSVVTTPSHCGACGKRIRSHDLIPVLSYLLLGGKCRFCGEKISLRYPMVELLNAAAYLLIYQACGLSIQFMGFSLLASSLIVIAFIDYDHKIIPDGVVLLLIGAGVIYSVFARDITWLDRLIGFFAASLPLYLILLLSKGGVGGGDIKLMAAVGIYLGWKLTLLSLLIGAVLGSIVAVILLIMKRKTRKDEIPFGPALAVGIMAAALYGNRLLDWYLGLL